MEKNKKLSIDEAENNSKTSLDALTLDGDDTTEYTPSEETVNFDDFMADFRSTMGQTAEPSIDKQKKEEDPQEEFLTSLPKKKQKKEKKIESREKPKSDSDWNEDITLAPEEYEDLDDGSGMQEIPHEEEIKPDFNLGEIAENRENSFQLSINFEGEEKCIEADEVKKEIKYDPDHPRIIDWVFDIAEMFVFVLAAVLILTSFIFKHSVVEGASMMNTLEHGDHLIITDMFYTPDYGDIVVFEDYSKPVTYRKAVIKRVIGLPGDTVEIQVADDGKTLEVLVNGQPINEEYAYYLSNKYPTPHGPVTVGEGQVYVLGDNRYNSTDSRDVGTINIDSILGKVILRFYPFDKFGAVN